MFGVKQDALKWRIFTTILGGIFATTNHWAAILWELCCFFSGSWSMLDPQEAKKKRKKKGKKWPVTATASSQGPAVPPFWQSNMATTQRFWPWDAHDFHGMAIMAMAISRNTRRYQKAAAWAYKLVDACTSFYNLFIFIQPSQKAVFPTKSKPLRSAHITSTRFVLADPYPTSLHSRMWSLCALA